jgi:hypothetical protein
MSDKERLREIKRKAMAFSQELREIDLEEHIDWLISQAEKVEQLETNKELFKFYKKEYEKHLKVLEQLQQMQMLIEQNHENEQWIQKASENVTRLENELKQAQAKAERCKSLFERVVRFMIDNKVDCVETIHQCDWVIENAYGFIEDLFNIIKSELPLEGEE